MKDEIGRMEEIAKMRNRSSTYVRMDPYSLSYPYVGTSRAIMLLTIGRNKVAAAPLALSIYTSWRVWI